MDAISSRGPRAGRRVLVYGATGHTGRFVVQELVRRGLEPVLSGRDSDRLAELGRRHPGLEVRPAEVAEAEALAKAVVDVAAVVNCAGPFLDTAGPVAAAAVGAGAHYLDVTAEQPSVQATYRAHGEGSVPEGVVVLPAMAFYGGLADLLASALADRSGGAVESVTTAVGLDRWWPTEGTRATGRRNTARRLVVADGRLVPAPEAAPSRTWDFPAPLGRHAVVALPFTEVIAMHRHLDAGRIDSYLSEAPLSELRDPATGGPEASDESGRSAQRFAVDVRVRAEGVEHRAVATGRDIYAVTAPLVAEAVTRVLDGRVRAEGAVAPGQVFDAADFLAALSPWPLDVELSEG
ncbi:saccharopine dehydrogenase-like protein [Nocardiopsis sp. Huas11]|uniref:saccharopine dehydrogenase NADP-binding domain-containing protein n=1 Tax=Nocardiopsis sp. Huas11 TaxID=2183912 RepID=UPI000EAC1231|nr:saccharopine dehydrogenase NADP-binding domain-containing protein [Nocardiopsis sp. Huas11]RKS08725.1 saccharopine dehydrogenase-like protein [Nocardiopsis sp. Huas11]